MENLKSSTCTLSRNSSAFGLTKLNALLLTLSALFNISCLGTDASEQVSDSSFGLNLTIISGNNQIGAPDELLENPAVVQVTDSSGRGVEGISITFEQINGGNLFITTGSAMSASNGTAQTNVRSPQEFNETGEVEACITGSRTCVTFTFGSDNTSENIKYQLITENDDIETAGVPFSVQVRTVDVESEALVEFDGTITLQWTFITNDSWAGVSPTVLPSIQICTFVAGVCDVPTNVTLTDTRDFTQIFVGDGDAGFIDVFGQIITVNADVPAQAVITDLAGGPLAGAVTIDDIVYTADDTDETFFAAITDAVGNYISDATTVSWSSTHPTEITANLSSTTGTSTTLDFNQSIPFPSFGRINVLADGFLGSSGQISIDPGVPVEAAVIPLDGNFTRTAGIEFEFDVEILDANGNIFGGQFGGTGYTGTFPVTFSFANHYTPPMVSGGEFPMLAPSGNFEYTGSSKTINIPFFGGRAQFLSDRITFYDATGVAPQVSASVNASLEPTLPNVSGTRTYNVAIGSPTRINLRDALGASGNALCYMDLSGGSSQQNLNNVFSNDYLLTSKQICDGLQVDAGDTALTMYASVEDAGGNFIANLDVNWVYTDAVETDSLIGDQVTGPVFGNNNTLTPVEATYGNRAIEWIRLTGTYLGTPYDQYLRANIGAGSLFQYDLRVRRPSHRPWNQAIATETQDLVIIPLDEQGNDLTQSFTRNISISSSGAFNNAPNGTTPIFISDGTFTNVLFERQIPVIANDNIGNSTAAAVFTGLRTPNAGDAITITVTDIDDPSITDTFTWNVVPGPVNEAQIWRDNTPAGGGTRVDGAAFSISTDDSTDLYAVAQDAFDNDITVNSSWVTWNDSIQPFSPGGAIDPLVSNTTQTPFNPQLPGNGRVYLNIDEPNGGNRTATTGLITINPGVPQSIEVTIDSETFTAGTSRTVTVRILDGKGNTVDTVNGPTNLAITILNNSPNRLGLDETAPPSGSYNFTNGQYVFSGAEAFAFFNSDETPTIQIATTGAGAVVGSSNALTINSDVFDHLALISSNNQVDAGVINRYTVRSEDQYGNRISSGADSSKTVTFSITSSLGDEDIDDSNLNSSNIGDYSLPGQTTVTGDLSSGFAFVDVRSTKAGNLTVDGVTTGGNMANNTEEPLTVLPLTVISGIRYKPGELPPDPSSTVTTITPFSVEVLDAFDNVITTNNSAVIQLSLHSGNTQNFSNYSDVTVVNGEAEFRNLRYTAAETFQVQANLQAGGVPVVNAPMTVQIGSPTESVIRIVGSQTFTEGTGSLAAAVTGTPHGTGAVTAGDTFNVEVRAVDSAFNTVPTYTAPVSLTSTDPYLEVLAGPSNFTGGIATFTVRVRQQGAVHNITAVTGLPANNPSSDYTVNYGAATQLVALTPGKVLLEGAPDLATAIDLNPNDQTAGVAFNVDVLALDAYYNHVDNYSHTSVGLAFDTDPAAPTPVNQAMSGGSATFSMQNFLALVGHTVTPTLGAAPALTLETSEPYTTLANVATQYIAVFPDGQTHVPGQDPSDYALAVTGTPNDQDTDTGFSVNILAVDAYFNIRTDETSAVSITTPNDPTDTEPAAGNFASGSRTFTINPVTAGANQAITVTSVLASNTPATYNVNPGAPSQLIAIFTDYQTLVEGNTSLTAAVADQTVQNRTSGESVNVRIYATDNEYNIVDDDTTTVSLTPSTANSNVAPASQALTDGQADFTVETYLVGTGYDILPGGGAYAQNRTTDYNVNIGAGKRLLIVMPNQTFAPGQATAADAAAGNPYDQTQGSDFSFPVTVYATDDFYNPRTSDTENVTLSTTLGSVISGGATQAMVGGQITFSLHHTAFGNSQTISATAIPGGFTAGTSKTYNINQTLGDPTLALSDPTTSDTTYIRQPTVQTDITNDGTAERWCVSETQSTRPVTADPSNNRGVCVGGGGLAGDDFWYTSDPGTVATTAAENGKTLYVWTSDDALNVSVNPVSDTITHDGTPPNNPAGLTLEDQSTMSTAYTNSATVDLDVTLTGDTVEWCVIEQPLINPVPTAPLYDNACWATKPGVFPTPYTLAITGDRAVYVFAKDIAENVSASYAVASITYDNAAPVFPGGADIIGVRGGTDAVADEWLGTTTAPIIEWQAATDDTPVTYTLTIRDGGSAVCGTPISGITGTSRTFGACLTNGNTYSVELVAEDSAEQSTTADNSGTFTFTVDTDAPAGFNITGLRGGADTTADAFLTNALTAPRVDWVDTTGETGYQVVITNTSNVPIANCGYDTAAQDASFYQGFAGCSLSDNTDYRVRVIAFDQAGNQTEATGSPFDFRTTEDIDNFLVELVPASNPVAGGSFSVRLTARRANNETVTSYAGSKSITFSSTASAGADVCQTLNSMAVELNSGSHSFTGGIATISGFTMKRVETGRTISATENDTGYSASGTSATFDVTAAALNCVRVEDAAGGAGGAVGPTTESIDTVITAHAAGYDLYGNFLGDQSVTWSGNGVLSGKPFPTSGTSTTVVLTEAGTGQLVASGTSVNANITVNPGNAIFTSSTTDQNSNNHLATNNVNAVYHWDVTADAVNGWRTSAGLSWHGEATSASRGAKDDFPEQVHLVGTNSGLDIIDASSNDLFMRFQSGANFAVDSDLGNIVDIAALNGKIFVSMDSGSTGGLIIIDLANDQVYQLNSSVRELSGNDIENRNSGATWSTNTTYPLLSASRMNKIVAKRVGGVDYVAIGENNGLDVLRVTAATAVYNDSTTNAVFAVDMDSSGTLYYGEDTVGLHRAALPSSGFTPDRTYTQATNAELASLSINDISLGEGASSAQGGQNTILVASNLGLTAIQEHSTFGSSTSKSYSTNGTGNNAFAGALSVTGTDGYVAIPDGGGLSATATFEFWFRPSSSVTNRMLMQKGSAVDGAVELSFNGSGNLVFTARHNGADYSVTSSSSSWSNNRWYHVAAQVTTTGIEMWIDGGDRQTNAQDFTIPSAFDLSSADLNLGGNGVAASFDGLIDELRVSTSAVYSGSSFTVPSSAFFVGYHLLHFDEASGGTANFADASAMQDGTLNNDSYFVTPLYAGSDEEIHNLDAFYVSSRINTQIATSSGWMEIMDLQGTAFQSNSDTSAACFDVKSYDRDSATDNDSLIGRSTGMQLRRR